jgi:hypothetical protein
VNGAQVWTVIGAFVATLAALVTLVLRLIDAKLDGLRAELLARFDSLERDVQRLYEHAYSREEPPAA